MISYQQHSSKDRTFKVGVVVPAYNEERLIADTLRGIPAYVDKIYVIDDARTDGTRDVVHGFKDSRITSARHAKNQGICGAITTGYKLALKDRMDIIAVMAGNYPSLFIHKALRGRCNLIHGGDSA